MRRLFTFFCLFWVLCCFRPASGRLAADGQSDPDIAYGRHVPVYCGYPRAKANGKQETLPAQECSSVLQCLSSRI